MASANLKSKVAEQLEAQADQSYFKQILAVFYDPAGNVIATHERKGDFKKWWVALPAELVLLGVICGR